MTRSTLRSAGLRCLALTAFLFVFGLIPTEAGALYQNAADKSEGAQLVSADYVAQEQGDDTSRFAAISANGRYVAIETFARNFFGDTDPDPFDQYRGGGIFRFDFETKRLAKVADGNLFRESDSAFLRRGAANPSLSADGRYVVFATAQQLLPADNNENVDVYLRDMTVALEPGEVCTGAGTCAYTLVSARDGGDEPAHYGPPAFPFPGSNPGADVTRGVAISADGTKVAFRTEAPSDLPARPGTDTPAGQIFVRDLSAKTTTLVTLARDPLTGATTTDPAGGALNAALSADGSTVAWTGSNAPAQTRFVPGENTDPSFHYYLWRRVADGPSAPTRRITGLSDPDDPACAKLLADNPGISFNFDQISTGPCFGPLTDQEANRTGISSQVPAMSADGRTVLFLTGAGPRPNANTGTGLDLYLTDMSPGLSRKQATVELTRDPANFDPSTSSPLTSVAISSNGRFAAVTTVRNQFQLPVLQPIGQPRTNPNAQELYAIDLQARTIERVTRSYGGGEIEADVQPGVTLSADGSRLAFSSFAGNLFFGDANQRADAFVATHVPELGETPAPPVAGGGGSSVELVRPRPRLAVRAKAKGAGVVVLTVAAPAAGAIKAVALARVGDPPKQRTIATRKTRSRGRGNILLVMRLEDRYRPAIAGGERLRAKIRVTFTPAAGGKRSRAATTAEFFAGSKPKS